MRFVYVLLFLLFHAATSADQQKRNIVLITIDTLRGDYLSCNGSSKVKTPNIDRLANEGANFLRARSHVPLTLPAHASIMTGAYPLSHRVHDNGTFQLAASNLTLAEILKSNGYKTAAIVSSFVLDHRFGLNQGFDFYDDNIQSLESMESLEAERNADAVYASFTKWFAENSNTPFLVWLHFYDPHYPYNPPSKFKDIYRSDPYAGEVAYTDAVIGSVIKDLEAKNILKNSIVFVVGDHGEGLGQHQESTHSLLIYNSTLHVPLILYAPGLIPAKTKYPHLVRLIDVAPTILDYAGIHEKVGEGISLRMSLQSGRDAGLKSYSESQYAALNLGWAELTGLESGKYHFINAPSAELYEVISDKEELKNVAAQNSDVVSALKKELSALNSARIKRKANEMEMDPETREKLASLGYVSGADANKQKRISNIDPKTQMDLFNRIQSGIADFNEKNYIATIEKFKNILSSHKNIYLVYDYLCSAFMKTQQWDRAENCIQTGISNQIDSSNFHLNLGLIHTQRKNYNHAEKEFQVALALQNTNVQAHFHLGNLYRMKGENPKAVESFKKALEINPDYFYAMNGLGMAYVALKRDEDALKTFQQAVNVEPRNVPGYFNLAVQAERMKRNQIAIYAYSRFLELSEPEIYSAERKKAQESLSRLR